MKLVFRVNYRTVPGQCIWLQMAVLFSGSGARIEQVMPLRWLNDHQWEAMLELQGAGPLHLAYNYQLRQDDNGVVLDEWLAPRTLDVEPATQDAVVLLDTWCSAGTPDYALETKAFATVLPPRGPFAKPPALTHPHANHEFQLRMAAVPPGQAPCITGSVSELGQWDWNRALPFVEVAANVWQLAVNLPADWHLEYKYGLREISSGRVISIEQGVKRVLPPHAFGHRQKTRISDEGYARGHQEKFRGCGVVVPVFSLRSDHGMGVGEFADLKLLADWAAITGLRMLQILPVNDTTSAHNWTDSYPYSAISAFALHPLYLRISDLPYQMPQEFIDQVAATCTRLNLSDAVAYEDVMDAKWQFTRQIYQLHQEEILANRDVRTFLKCHRDWLLPYAAFCLLRDRHQSADFSRWGEWAVFNQEKIDGLADPSGEDFPELFYHLWLQYELDNQLTGAVRHMHQQGIILMGDLPIGIDRQSADAWSSPHLFNMDTQAGAPPDAFAKNGQNWGFPTYNWQTMQADGYAWWQSRFSRLSRHFDVYRIDHVLGFFRIWQIPRDHVDGLMGWFDPALPVTVNELHARGINFDFNRFCRPYIREHSLAARFGKATGFVKREFLSPCGHGYWMLQETVSTQRRIVDHFTSLLETDAQSANTRKHDYDAIRDALLACAAEVILLEVPASSGSRFHPRCEMRQTQSYQELDDDLKWRFDELYNDYFYRRQEACWQAAGYAKLPFMRLASPMLLVGEDLGMIPACVAGVMAELGILSLEVQRMPKNPQAEFFHPADAPYLSMVCPSTHDMPTLREWWRNDSMTTARFARNLLEIEHPQPDLSAGEATRIIGQHLHSPAMWAVFSIQDLLAMDESLRHPDAAAERINDPAIMPYYWRYRMHLTLGQLIAADAFNHSLLTLVNDSGR